MLQKMIDRILALAPIQTITFGSRNYAKSSLHQITPPEFEPPEVLTLNTLSGMVEYLESLDEEMRSKVFLQVNDFNSVSLLGLLQPENSNKRFTYARSQFSVSQFSFSQPT